MTTVNWEREPGETVEQFVAALIVLRFEHGNLITPSKGDRGIDVRVPRDSGFDIYQIKRYASRLDSKQKKDIKHSWDTFLRATASQLPIASWKLALPWDPTNEALEWLDALTTKSGIPHEWIGRTTLDAWAAENPRLVEYYFGNGADRWQELMARAALAGAPIPEGDSPSAVLGAVQQRAAALQSALDEVDPFYWYEVEVRAGIMPEIDEAQVEQSSAALITYVQSDPGYYVATRIIPRTPVAAILRPIKQQVEFIAKVGSDEAEALERFRLFGKPIHRVEASVIATEGPPGSPEPGEGILTFFASAANIKGMPPLELRIVDVKGDVVTAVPARQLQHSSGLGTGGHWISMSDPAGILTLEFMFGVPDQPATVIVKTRPSDGGCPSEVAATLRLAALFTDDHKLEVGVEDGPIYMGPWQMRTDEVSAQAKSFLPLVEDLVVLQRHSTQKVVVPLSDRWKPDELPKLNRAARMLRGEELRDGWSHLTMTLEHPELLPGLIGASTMLKHQRPLSVLIAGVDVETDRVEQILFVPAVLAANQDVENLKIGSHIHFVPGKDAVAISTAVERMDLDDEDQN